MRKTGVVVLAFCSVSPMLHAGEMFTGSDDEAGDIPVVLSATRLRQSLADTPASVTIIDRQMIELTGVRELPELLRLVPGMVVGYENSSEAFVSQHGTSADLARRMQVLIDGRSVYQPLLASVDWIGLPLALDDIERIEVTRGPNSAAYGVNSFFGVVNIITRHPADAGGGDLSYVRGENGVEDYRVRLGHRTGEVDWRLTAAGRADDGYRYNIRNNRSDFTDSKNTDSVYGRMVWSPDPGSALDVSFGVARMKANMQYRSPYIIQSPLADRDNSFFTLSWESDLDARNRLRVQASQSRFSRDEPWLVSIPPLVFQAPLVALYDQNRTCANAVIKGKSTGCGAADLTLIGQIKAALAADPQLMNAKQFIAPQDTKENRTEFEINDTLVLSPTLRGVAGLTFDYADVTSQSYLNGRQTDQVAGAFAHMEWRFAPKWLLNVGGSLEDDQVAERYFTPRYALNWQAADNQTFRLIYSKAIRSPDILENRAYWQLNVDAVDPADDKYNGTFYQRGISAGNAPAEKIDSREVGYYGRFDRQHLTVDIRLFNDQMWLAEHDLEIDHFNIAQNLKYVLRGNEVAVDWRPVAGHRFQLNYAYLDMNVSQQMDNANFVPLHSGSAAWWQDKGEGWKFGSTYYFYNDLRAETLYFDRLDLQLIRQIPLPGKQRLDLTAVLQKRFSKYAELRSENGPEPHRAWIGLNYHFL